MNRCKSLRTGLTLTEVLVLLFCLLVLIGLLLPSIVRSSRTESPTSVS